MAAGARRAGGGRRDGCGEGRKRRSRIPARRPPRSGAPPVTEPRGPSGLRILLTVFLPFGCGYYLSYLFRTVNAVLSENLVGDLGIGPADLGLLTSIYLIAFASSQIPLGVALDRYGPRLLNAGLLAFAAAGAAVFAVADDFAWLLAGRALIGFGVSAALMGAFKANAMWFPAERLPLMNNLTGAFGAFGAVSATRPVEMLLDVAGWREIFAGLAALTAAAALVILVVVPERRAGTRSDESLRRQISGYAEIVRDGTFWRVTLLYASGFAAFLSYQTLWADPWLRDVAGLGQSERADRLFHMQAFFLAGLLAVGFLADRLRRGSVAVVDVFGFGVLALALLQIPLALGIVRGSGAVLCLFGFASSAAYLAYAVVTAHFPATLTGRAITAMNFFMFVAAFAMQWGVGGIIESFPPRADGGYSAEGHAAALWTLIGIQLLCFAHFARGRLGG